MHISTTLQNIVLRPWSSKDYESLVLYGNNKRVWKNLWGRGIATASARALKEYAFSGSRFKRLEAPVLSWSPASMKVLERIGFVREGVLRNSGFKDGELVDQVMYAVITNG